MTKKVTRKTIQLSLMILMIICTVLSTSVPSLAASAQEEKSTDICVIYDNSGSTYQDETWCRYKYVLEVMASLVDYDNGGRMYIYPLCDVSLDGRESSASCEPISIASYADIGKISNMLTTTPANTPFEPVENAYKYLVDESSADDKRLVILTDGMFNGFGSAKEFETRLLQMAKHSRINIHYFGSGDAVHISSKESEGLYSYSMSGLVDTQQLLDFTIDLCGMLFNQTKALSSKSELTNISVNSNCKVIVFANGKSSTVLGLTNNNDIAIPFLYDTGRHKYSTTKAIGYSNAPIDTSLESYISIFDCTEPGEYTLNCKNAELVNIYVQHESDNTSSNTGMIYPQDNSSKSPQEHSGESIDVKVIISALLLVITVIIVVICLFIYVKKARAKQQNNNTSNEVIAPTITSDKPGYAFISYSTKNQSSADAIRNLLHKNNIATWMAPNDIPAGSKYAAVISGAIKNCSCFLLLLTHDSQNSKWVPKEVERAVNYGKTIVPVQLEEVVLNDEFEMYLSTDQILPIKKINETSSEIQDLINVVIMHTKSSDC